MNLNRNVKHLILSFIIGMIVVSCGKGNKDRVDFVYANWSEGIAMVHVAKVLLEKEGFNIDLMKANEALLFSTLAEGEADVFLESWLPITHKPFMEQYGNSIEELGVIYEDAQIGFVVPDYVSIDSISQLNDHAEKFDHKIWGIEQGASIMDTTELTIKNYNLDFELKTSSESGMLATLKRAIDKDEWVVITGWKPHWMFSRYDLKILKGSSKVFGEKEHIVALGRKNLSKDKPYIAQFVNNMTLNDDEMGSLMQVFEENSNQEKAAKIWIDQHQELVDSWLPDDNLKKKRNTPKS